MPLVKEYPISGGEDLSSRLCASANRNRLIEACLSASLSFKTLMSAKSFWGDETVPFLKLLTALFQVLCQLERRNSISTALQNEEVFPFCCLRTPLIGAEEKIMVEYLGVCVWGCVCVGVWMWVFVGSGALLYAIPSECCWCWQCKQ